MLAEKKPYHTYTEKEVLQEFNTHLKTGLDDPQVDQARLTYGTNELRKKEGKSIFEMIFDQFKDLMVIILLIAATISFIIALIDSDEEEGFYAYVEPFVILLILAANAIIGVWQENNAEAALEALKEMQSDEARVLRNGQWMNIESKLLVPGDVVRLHVGDRCPADCRLVELETPTLKLSQATLTGESMDVSKHTEALPESLEN